jgi:RHS repeat-associated protein
VFGPQLISQRQTSSGSWARTFYVYDGHGDVRMLTDETGAVTDGYDYDAFGNLLHVTGSTPNDYRYGGERFDSSLGLAFLRARYMNPGTARFITADKADVNAEDPLTINRFVYAGENPVNRFDPTGMFTREFGYAVEGAIKPLYLADHGQDEATVMFGRVLTTLDLRIKPDIVNLANTQQVTPLTWEEIKPFTPSGVLRAIASETLYRTLLSPLGFDAESWMPWAQPILVDNEVVFLFAIDGILFYTDQDKAFEEGLALTSLAGATALASQLNSTIVLEGANAARGLFGGARAAINAAISVESDVDVAFGF